MAYTPQTWNNKPATDTPLSATRLGNLEAGLAAASAVADGAAAVAAAAVTDEDLGTKADVGHTHVEVTADTLTGTSVTGKAVMQGDAAAGRTALGLGTAAMLDIADIPAAPGTLRLVVKTAGVWNDRWEANDPVAWAGVDPAPVAGGSVAGGPGAVAGDLWWRTT